MNDQRSLLKQASHDAFRSLRAYWHVAGASSRLGASPRGVRVLDLDLALFRDRDGRPHALLDRCCHRGVKLSLGRVEDDHLACRYHGWRYEGGGACVHIPSLPDGRRVAAGCAVPSFPCEERDGYIWVWLAGAVDARPPVPGIPGFDRHRWKQGSILVDCDYMCALENGLDWCHAAFTHRWTHGQFFETLAGGMRDQFIRISATPDGLLVEGPVTEAGAADRGSTNLLKLAFRLPYQIDIDGPGSRRIVLHCIPTGPNRCRIEWLTTPLLPFGRRVRWIDKEPIILRQDRLILENISGGVPSPHIAPETLTERSVEADAPTLLLRRIIESSSRGAWDAHRALQTDPRILRIRA